MPDPGLVTTTTYLDDMPVGCAVAAALGAPCADGVTAAADADMVGDAGAGVGAAAACEAEAEVGLSILNLFKREDGYLAGQERKQRTIARAERDARV